MARGAVQGVVRPVDGLTLLGAIAKHLRIARAEAQLVWERDLADAAKEFEVALTVFAVGLLIFLETIARAIARLVAQLARFEFLGRNFLAVSAPVIDANRANVLVSGVPVASLAPAGTIIGHDVRGFAARALFEFHVRANIKASAAQDRECVGEVVSHPDKVVS